MENTSTQKTEVCDSGKFVIHTARNAFYTRYQIQIPDTKTQLLAIAIGKDRLKAEKMVPTNLVEL